MDEGNGDRFGMPRRILVYLSIENEKWKKEKDKLIRVATRKLHQLLSDQHVYQRGRVDFISRSANDNGKLSLALWRC